LVDVDVGFDVGLVVFCEEVGWDGLLYGLVLCGWMYFLGIANIPILGMLFESTAIYILETEKV